MWVRQGRTDAWIAHKLDVSVDELARFKREHQLDEGDEAAPARPADPLSVPPPEPPAALDELSDEEEPEEEEEGEPPRERARRRRRPARRRVAAGSRDDEDELEDDELAGELGEAQPDGPADGDDSDEGDEDGAPRRRRRRGRRGGRRHRGRRAGYEGTFDHGEEGYGLWLDPAVAENPVYSEHWAGHRAVTVTVDPDAITIRRAPAASGPSADADPIEDD